MSNEVRQHRGEVGIHFDAIEAQDGSFGAQELGLQPHLGELREQRGLREEVGQPVKVGRGQFEGRQVQPLVQPCGLLDLVGVHIDAEPLRPQSLLDRALAGAVGAGEDPQTGGAEAQRPLRRVRI
jgi:hypothetical protein